MWDTMIASPQHLGTRMKMSKLIKAVWIVLALISVARAQTAQHNGHFSKFKAVEAYEIRPGILMMPRYAQDGGVCEIGLEPLHYMPDQVKTNPSLSRETIDQIVDELAPADERGPRTKLFGGRDVTELGGLTVTTVVEDENVSVQIASRDRSNPSDYVAVVIRWKNRRCR
jgi:hypothetical protein